MSLAGKVALVTGGSRGIGRAIALELAAAGARIVVNYFRHRDRATSTVAEVQALGTEAMAIRAHVGKAEAVGQMFEAIKEHFGGVDILVCNAASGVFRLLMDIDTPAWNWTMSINAQSVLWCVQAAVPMMEQRGGGRIVNISSIGSGSGRVFPLYAMVGLSKGTLETLTRYLAVELAPKGITVNAVSPGVVMTEAWNNFPGHAEVVADIHKRTPKGRFVRPEDVAKLVAFLCSPAADMIVGQTIVIDGGFTLTL